MTLEQSGKFLLWGSLERRLQSSFCSHWGPTKGEIGNGQKSTEKLLLLQRAVNKRLVERLGGMGLMKNILEWDSVIH